MTIRDTMCHVRLNREALRAIRERSGFSKSELAEQAGIDRTLVGRLETGSRKGTDAQIASLATALSVPVVAIIHIDADGVAA